MERVNDRVRKILQKAGVREMLGPPENIDGAEVYILWDESEQVADEYTVIIDGAVFGMGSYPQSPGGFNQFSGLYIDQQAALEAAGSAPVSEGYEAYLDRHIIDPGFVGSQKQVKFADVPEAVQQAIRQRIG